jgi:hypothetical protein
VALDVQDAAHSARVSALGDHRKLADLELEDVEDFATLDVDLNEP